MILPTAAVYLKYFLEFPFIINGFPAYAMFWTFPIHVFSGVPTDTHLIIHRATQFQEPADNSTRKNSNGP